MMIKKCKDKLKKATDELLDALYIVSHDGGYADMESLIECLEDIGVSEETIRYHLKPGQVYTYRSRTKPSTDEYVKRLRDDA